MTTSAREHLLNFTMPQLQEHMRQMDQPPYRAGQLFRWMYRDRAATFEKMTNLPADFRARLREAYIMRALELAGRRTSAADGTVRLDFRGDFSAVYLRGRNYDGACLSTQSGCGRGCVFCASGKIPLRRNLSAGEMVEQVLMAAGIGKHPPDNLLFMGMGEPLDNIDNLLRTIDILMDRRGLAYGRRRITVSTVGCLDGIRRLAEEGHGVNLAISLHAPDDGLRRRLTPSAAEEAGIAELIGAARDYKQRTNSRLTVEYVLIGGVNDRSEHADELSKILKRTGARVNLIPCNPVPGVRLARPDEGRALEFQKRLIAGGAIVFIRKSMGLDISGACGQLGLV